MPLVLVVAVVGYVAVVALYLVVRWRRRRVQTTISPETDAAGKPAMPAKTARTAKAASDVEATTAVKVASAVKATTAVRPNRSAKPKARVKRTKETALVAASRR